MANNILSNILAEYELKRTRAINDSEYKKQAFFKEHSELEDIDFKIKAASASLSKLILMSASEKDVETAKKNIEKLRKSKEQLLKKYHFNENDFKPIFDCEICNDSGFVQNGLKMEMCSCLKQRLYDEEYNKLNTYDIKNNSFENFSLTKYSNKVDKEKYDSDISPRENIKIIKEIAENFINNFDDVNTKNLLFIGNTGLGKTFLSNCIANSLIKQGKTVLYQTAPVMLDTIINYHMYRNQENKDIMDHLLSVDLLIIDDLGTESMNSLKFSDFFTIINSRLLNQNNKITKTIISTNLDLNELADMYGERIISRYVGSYDICKFFGDDIRFLNK